MSTPLLPFAVWQSGTNENSLPANDNSLRDEARSREVLSKVTTAQPVSPGDGDVYIIPPAATGTQWATFDIDDITIYRDGTWYAWAPVSGLVVNVNGTLEQYTGSAGWAAVGGGGGGMTNPMTTAGDLITGGSGGSPQRLGVGSNGDVLTVSGGVPVWASGGGALTNWTEAVSTAAPNATIPAVSFTATNAASNVDAVLRSKGTGATLANIPDNTTTGGNKRGTSATDLQKSRNNANQIALGNFSTIAGGRNNRADGSDSVVAGGTTNQANGTESFVGGGNDCQATGNQSTCSGGQTNAATMQGSTVSGGRSNTSNGLYSWIPGGRLGTCRSVESSSARGISAYSATAGQAQEQTYILAQRTTNATTTPLCTDTAASASATNQAILPNNFAYVLKGLCVAREAATGDTKSWEFTAHIKRGANAASTAMVAAATVNVLSNDAGAAAWVLAVGADTTLGALSITATGEAAKTIGWVATIYSCVQVGA